MRRSARPKRPAPTKVSGARAGSPSTSDLESPSISPTPEGPTRHYGTPGKRADGNPKRPMNAFILFSNEKRSVLADENPHLSNAAVSVLLGQRWREMPTNEKAGYVSAAKRIKDDFHAANPDAKTRCVARKGKRAKLDASGRSTSSARTVTQPSLQALAMVGSRLNQSGCDTASTYTQGTMSYAASTLDAPSRRSYDDDDDDDDDDDAEMWDGESGHGDEQQHAAGPSGEAGREGRFTLLEQLCSIAETEHNAAAAMLSTLHTAG